MPAFRLPDIGEGLTEAEIVRWFVAVGDEVAVDQIIVEVETAKTVVEIQSPFAGTVTELGGDPGTTIEVGQALFIIGTDTEVRSQKSEVRSPMTDDGSANTPVSEPNSADSSASRSIRSSDIGSRSSVRAMPLVRKLATDKGIDLASVAGTGPGGAVTRADVEAYTQPPSVLDGELVALTPTRRAVAEHMSASWREIPHVTVQAEFRAENLLAARRIGDRALSIEAVVAARVLPLLDEFPQFNARFTDRGILLRTDYHLGFAVDTEAGLIVVVAKNASNMSIEEIDTEFVRLATAAQTRTITADEVTGQTFTISNIGALGGGHGTPIIPLGTTAILSIGRAKEAAIAVNGTIEVGVVAPLDLSYDHRVIDGGLGQRFFGAVVEALEAEDS